MTNQESTSQQAKKGPKRKRRSSAQAARHRAEEEAKKIPREKLEKLSNDFRANRRKQGRRTADKQWLEEAIGQWAQRLETETDELDNDAQFALTVAMNDTLAVRDALIVSLVADEHKVNRDQLMEFAITPHSEHAKSYMKQLLTESFESLSPNKARCYAGLNMLADMVDSMPTPYDVQPLAIMAYVLWWMGDSRAAVVALHCLSKDEDCSLAAMVFSAVDRGVRPAWCRS